MFESLPDQLVLAVSILAALLPTRILTVLPAPSSFFTSADIQILKYARLLFYFWRIFWSAALWTVTVVNAPQINVAADVSQMHVLLLIAVSGYLVSEILMVPIILLERFVLHPVLMNRCDAFISAMRMCRQQRHYFLADFGMHGWSLLLDSPDWRKRDMQRWGVD